MITDPLDDVPEPWRSIRLRFRKDCQQIMRKWVPPKEPPAPPFVRAAHRMADLRRSKGWSLATLAKLSGWSSSMLSEFERALRNPTIKQRADIAQSLGVDVEDIWW